MTAGIFGASLTTLTNGTTANAPDVLGNDQALKTNGVNNDGGLIITDGAGSLVAVGLHATGDASLITFLTTPYQFVLNDSINSGSTKNYTLTGVGTPIVPSGARGALITVYYSSTTVGAFLQACPHGATIANTSDYPVLGVVQVSGVTMTMTTLVALDANGKIDLKANTGNCTSISGSINGYVY